MVADKGPDTVALVFYAGHGVQVDGENFLIPVDAQIEREADVPLQAMRLADVMNALSSIPSKSSIVILDACRNNPFSAINKTAGRGLAMVDAPRGLAGVLLDRARHRGPGRRWCEQPVHDGAHERSARSRDCRSSRRSSASASP